MIMTPMFGRNHIRSKHKRRPGDVNDPLKHEYTNDDAIQPHSLSQHTGGEEEGEQRGAEENGRRVAQGNVFDGDEDAQDQNASHLALEQDAKLVIASQKRLFSGYQVGEHDAYLDDTTIEHQMPKADFRHHHLL